MSSILKNTYSYFYGDTMPTPPPKFDEKGFKKFTQDLKTGDILLYQTGFWYSRLIEYFTGSIYSHISIVLKNPTWIDPNLNEEYYILESGAEVVPDAVSGQMIFGVQIIPLSIIYEEYTKGGYGHLYVRHLKHNKSEEDLKKGIFDAYQVVKNKPYDLDPFDWIKALYDIHDTIDDLDKRRHLEKLNTFWCSALVAYIFVECGFLPKTLPWTIINPNDFSYFDKEKRLEYIDCELGPEKCLV